MAGSCSLITGCHVIIERRPNSVTEPINLAELRLYNSSGSRISSSQLSIVMSSTLTSPLAPASNCLDGNTDTYCHTTLTDASAWLRVTYPCAQGLSRVDVVNRKDCCQIRIQQFRMRAVSNGTDLATAYEFTSSASDYTWPLGK